MDAFLKKRKIIFKPVQQTPSTIDADIAAVRASEAETDNIVVDMPVSMPVPPVDKRYVSCPMTVTYYSASQIGKVLTRIAVQGHDVTLDFDTTEGLRATYMNASKSYYIELKIPVSSFINYIVPSKRTFTLYSSQVRGFSALCRKDQSATFFVTPKRPAKFCARVYSKDSDRTMYFDTKDRSGEDEDPIFTIDNIPYTLEATLAANRFSEEVSVLDKNNSSNVMFVSHEDQSDKLVLYGYSAKTSNNSASNETSATVHSMSRSSPDAQFEEQAYAIEFLKKIVTFHDVSTNVSLRYGSKDQPLCVRFQIMKEMTTNKKDAAPLPVMGTIDILLQSIIDDNVE